MARISPKEFVGTRVRFTRLRDARIFNGWLESVFGNRFQVLADANVPLAIDEGFMFEAHGKRASAMFSARLVEVEGIDLSRFGEVAVVTGSQVRVVEAARVPLVFAIESALRLSLAVQPYRVRVSGVQTLVTAGSQEYQALILDASAAGVALLSDVVFEPGSAISFRIESPNSRLNCSGLVRYGRSMGPLKKSFRSGVRLDQLNRLDGPRWAKFVEEAA